MFDIWNRRYTGSKYKLSSWISKLIEENCEGDFFCDIFAGMGIISYTMLNKMKKIYINDFLYSVVKILHITQKLAFYASFLGYIILLSQYQ
ncbi:DNA adenine methylase [uncultured Ruminococcus sp.]|uniref:DNA adenine methylase n=1 Tax=uncultured Ruminococcus sp. TaxID=165186 RepID=UPI00349F6FAD